MFGKVYTFVYFCILMSTTNNNKPFPIKLGELKPLLQEEAFSNDRSLHYWIKKILKEYINLKEKVKK